MRLRAADKAPALQGDETNDSETQHCLRAELRARPATMQHTMGTPELRVGRQQALVAGNADCDGMSRNRCRTNPAPVSHPTQGREWCRRCRRRSAWTRADTCAMRRVRRHLTQCDHSLRDYDARKVVERSPRSMTYHPLRTEEHDRSADCQRSHRESTFRHLVSILRALRRWE